MSDQYNQHSLGLKSFLILVLENLGFIFIFTTILTIISIIYSLMATPVYEASAAMTHSSAMSRSQSSSASLDEIASFVSTGGIDSAGVSSEEKIAIQRITSKDYFTRIYENPILISCLYQECDLSNFDIHTFDEIEYQKSDSFNAFSKPPFMVAYRHFRAQFRIFPNVEVVNFSFKHFSPKTAYDFLNWIIIDANNYIRDHDVAKANKTIDFLSNTLVSKRNVEVQKLVAALMQKEIQTLALSEKTDYFAFEIIDSPYIPEDRIYPRRSLIVITTFLISIFFAVSLLILEHVFNVRDFIKSLEIRKRVFSSTQR